MIYIKPVLCGEEPADVAQYASSDSRFPQQPTSDQWFSESQFESYRRLGLHTVEHIMQEIKAATKSRVPLEKFSDAAEKHMKGGAKIRIPLDVRVLSTEQRDMA